MGRNLIVISVQFRLGEPNIQGRSGNSDDGNRRKPVRITQLVRITRTMLEKIVGPKTNFFSKRSQY